MAIAAPCLQLAAENYMPAMWIFLITLVLLFNLVLWLPIEVEVDTRNDLYTARWRGLAGFRVVPGPERWQYFFRILFWEITFRPGAGKKREAREKVRKQEQKKASRKSKRSLSFRQMRLLLRNLQHAVRVRKLWINWDTHDFPLNARLYPWFRMFSRGRRQLFINFQGEQELAIHLQTRLGTLARAALPVLFISKK
ncbi:MAG: hypothetical protein EP344_00900 [Bacteroidetes bacterium]|nr:MAG: hypothetical protein EP344_00900 [Bacteroidota bacterium]